MKNLGSRDFRAKFPQFRNGKPENFARKLGDNLGAVGTPDALVTALLPDGTVFVTATDQAGAAVMPTTSDGQAMTWNVGPVAADVCCRHIFIALKTGADLAEGAPLTLTATIATTAAESDLSNNSADAGSLVCDMAGSSKQVHAGEVMPGDVLTYTLQLQYQHRAGEPNQRWVDVTDTLPISQLTRFLGWNGGGYGHAAHQPLTAVAGAGARR